MSTAGEVLEKTVCALYLYLYLYLYRERSRSSSSPSLSDRRRLLIIRLISLFRMRSSFCSGGRRAAASAGDVSKGDDSPVSSPSHFRSTSSWSGLTAVKATPIPNPGWE